MAKKGKLVPRPGADPNLKPPSKIDSTKRANSSSPPPTITTKKQKAKSDPETTIKHSNQSSVSTSSSSTGDFFASDDELKSIDTNSDSMASSNTNTENSRSPSPSQEKPRQRAPPPFLLKSSDWRKIAPTIFKNSDFTFDDLKAKISSDGNISVQTPNANIYRAIQKIMIDHEIPFHTHNFPEDRTIKVVLRGVPTDISEQEITDDLINRGYEVNLVKRFGPKDKPMPIVLVVLKRNPSSSEIYNITNLFFFPIIVETFKKSGPAQCFLCQRFGHGSSNCHYPHRCVKCSGQHLAKDCIKQPSESPCCCNCGGDHPANYRGCPYYKNILETTNPSKPKDSQTSQSRTVHPPPSAPEPKGFIPNTIQPKSYANVLKTSHNQPPPPPNNNVISISKIVDLLKDLLISLSSQENSKETQILIINSFLTLLSQNE
jgi:hypothetical protein